MLVLSRKRGEKILIADGEVKIVVVEIRGDKVRLGIEAPQEISVHREEVFLTLPKNKTSADGGDGDGR